MIKNKLVVVAMAGMLAMCVGLTACGGSASSSSAATSSAASSSASAASSSASAASSAASSSKAGSEIVFWQGTLADGSVVSYLDNAFTGEAVLFVVKSDLSDGAAWLGSSSSADNVVVTVTDAETNHAIKYTIVDISPTSFNIDLEGYGAVELKPVTKAEIQAAANELATIAAAEGEKVLKEIESAGAQLEKDIADSVKKISDEFNSLDENTVFFWSTTLANGMSVNYMDNSQTKDAFLSILTPDASNGFVWEGSYTESQDGKTKTITDHDTGITVTLETVETNPGVSMKMNIEELGEVELHSVTKADFVKAIDELSKLVNSAAA